MAGSAGRVVQELSRFGQTIRPGFDEIKKGREPGGRKVENGVIARKNTRAGLAVDGERNKSHRSYLIPAVVRTSR
jgi:hypothetical protein